MTQVQLVAVGLKFGEFQALREVNATFDAGRIHGIVGRNGSGKTVLLKCICGLLDAYSGQITINGVDRRNRKALGASMGIIIEAPGFVAGYSGLTNLKFLADIRHQAGRKEIVQAMEMVGLDPKCKKHVEKYSLGMRQRLGIAQAIMENPDMLVLDEPMNDWTTRGSRTCGSCSRTCAARGNHPAGQPQPQGHRGAVRHGFRNGRGRLYRPERICA